MEKNTKLIAIALVVIVIVGGVAAVALTSGTKKTTITEKGSDTMLELMQSMAEQYNDQSNNASVSVSGGGSGVGITALIEKNTNVCQASRAMTPAEIANATNHGVTPVEFKVAVDGIAIIINTQNTGVTNLTMDQLHGIYNGTITNWNKVGGSDLTITAFGRQSTSGTYQYFQEVVMKKENFASGVSQETGNAQIASKVEQTAGGVGYVGIGYAIEAVKSGSSKILTLESNSTTPGYLPTDSTAVYNGSYPLARYLFLYTDGQPTGAIYDWMSFILSDKGQSIVDSAGFYKLPPDVLSQMKTKLG